MSEKNAGNDPAYPVIGAPGAQQDYPGLTKRELIAAMSLQGIRANAGWIDRAAFDSFSVADQAVHDADALLAELAKDRAA